MYKFEIDSPIGKVIKKQRRQFWLGFNPLKGKDSGLIVSRGEGEKDSIALKKYFVSGEYRGCETELYDIYTRDMKNKYFFFITNKGEFCRFWREKDMFGGNGLMQHVYTVLSSDGKSVTEIRANIDEDAKIVQVSDADKEEYRRLCVQRKGAQATLHMLEGRGAEDVSI